MAFLKMQVDAQTLKPDSKKRRIRCLKVKHDLIINEMKQKDTKKNFPGYPENPVSEDVYSNWKEERALDPEDLTKRKSPNEVPGTLNEKDFQDDMSGADLDIPGSELDDQQESVGSEDEENNFYSIGGGGHNDLEEDLT